MGIRLKLLGVGLGAAAAVWGFQEKALSANSGDDAVKITCRALGTSGPGGNAHVVMTGFGLAPNFVYQSGKSGGWTKVWVPAVPLDGPYAKAMAEAFKSGGDAAVAAVPLPKPVSVIVTSSSIADQKAFDALGDKDELEGLVINSIETMDGEERKLLEKSYGDVSKAQILDVGRTRTHPMFAWLGMLGGTGAALFVVTTFFRRKAA